jgi:hypothetical protein
MRVENAPFTFIEWSAIPAVEQSGETGFSVSRTVEAGNVRARMMEYSPGFAADHRCPRGHVVLVLAGELVTELEDGRRITLTPGCGFVAANDLQPHRTSSANAPSCSSSIEARGRGSEPGVGRPAAAPAAVFHRRAPALETVDIGARLW